MQGFSVGRCDLWKRGLLLHWSLIIMLSSRFTLVLFCISVLVGDVECVCWVVCVACVCVCVCVFYLCVVCE